MMRPARWFSLILLLVASHAFAQDEPKPDQLKKMYDDALAQLKTVQDRRNELAQQNETLTAKVKELEAKVAATEGQLDALRKDATGYAEKTFYLRSHYAAWQGFLQTYPELLSRWKLYLGNGLTVPKTNGNGANGWPFDVAG